MSNCEFPSSNLEQRTALPVDASYEYWEDAKEAIEYLSLVREEAKTVRTSAVEEKHGETEIGLLSIEEETPYSFDEFKKIIECDVSQCIRNVRSSSLYYKKKSDIVDYISSLRDQISNLTEQFQTTDIITESDWSEIINSDREPCVSVGRWNSYNWCSLLEHLSNKIQKDPNSLSINTRMTHWILLALISIHSLDSYSPNVSHNMQVIKRYLESTNFDNIQNLDYLRIETILIVIKYIFNQQ